MNHENCHQLLESLSEYVDGTLGDEICLEIERHMQNCENCRIVVDSLRKTIFLYHATATPPYVPDEVRERLYHRLDLTEFLNKGV
jgi:predicted anti-sigma-YlaC factor YlaD